MIDERLPLRPAVRWFAEAMEAGLRRNDHKGTWADCTYSYLEKRLGDEKRELIDAVTRGTPEEVLHEAADLANFAMMIADVFQPVVRDEAWYAPVGPDKPDKPAKARKPHYSKLLKAFVEGASGGLARLELRRMDLIEPYARGPKWRLTARGRERAERLGYLKKGEQR